MSGHYIPRVVFLICVGVGATNACSTMGFVDVNTVSAYGGDHVTLTIRNPNTCGLDPANPAGVSISFAGAVLPTSDVDVISASSVSFITPQSQRFIATIVLHELIYNKI